MCGFPIDLDVSSVMLSVLGSSGSLSILTASVFMSKSISCLMGVSIGPEVKYNSISLLKEILELAFRMVFKLLGDVITECCRY